MGGSVDHILAPAQASTEGMVRRLRIARVAAMCHHRTRSLPGVLLQPLAEEREEAEGVGRDVEHIMSGTPLVPHEVQEPQTGGEDMD